MNSVSLIGRLTRDPEVRYGSDSQTAVGRLSIAIDRGKDRNGNDLGTDFPTVVCFGKTAENCERFLKKGRLVGVQGKIRTGKYENKNGQTVYTTEVYADRIEFLEWGDRDGQASGGSGSYVRNDEPAMESQIPGGFTKMTDDDIPF
jgi:single-strand DNA-binding protein